MSSYYQIYEWNHAALTPFRAASNVARLYFENPFNPLSHTPVGRSAAAACELFERTTRRYAKPEFGIKSVLWRGMRVPVYEDAIWRTPFCRLLHFAKAKDPAVEEPKLLLVAPMSGHHATLLRGTVEAFLPDFDIYITDWVDARMIPRSAGSFDLDDYIDHVISILRALGPDTHVVAVCQPSVPVLAAVALMEEAGDPDVPATMTLMGGPIDTRLSPTVVSKLAAERGLNWFKRNVVMTVPFPHPGFGREVYPGFLQLSGFMTMNLDRHVTAHRDFFTYLVQGDGDSAAKHREFYNEYMAVMDLNAEFYLQTIDTVFIRHDLARGEMTHRGHRVDPAAIRRTALLTVEGEFDDITGKGQTQAAHRLCANVPDERRAHYTQPRVGHFGVFNGSRFRAEIAPRIRDFIRTHHRRPAASAGLARRPTTRAPRSQPLVAMIPQ